MLDQKRLNFLVDSLSDVGYEGDSNLTFIDWQAVDNFLECILLFGQEVAVKLFPYHGRQIRFVGRLLTDEEVLYMKSRARQEREKEEAFYIYGDDERE